MVESAKTWALVLAAGAGTRLHSITTTADGVAVPKQYCSLYGDQSLLQDALGRAGSVASPSRVCCIVAAQHQRWWARELSRLPPANVIVQPENRGTGYGILMPLLLIVARDPDAQVVILPADHHLRDEAVFADSLRRAAALAASSRDLIYLLGMEPNEADTGLGYIVPLRCDGRDASCVSKFVEKPTLKRARALLRQGALWNAFVIAARASQLIKLYQTRFAEAAAEMAALPHVAPGAPEFGLSISALYQRLTPIDFCRDVLEGQEAMLRVLTVPNCGWTDLGTPQRVARALQQAPAEVRRSPLSHFSVLNLSARDTSVASAKSPEP